MTSLLQNSELELPEWFCFRKGGYTHYSTVHVNVDVTLIVKWFKANNIQVCVEESFYLALGEISFADQKELAISETIIEVWPPEETHQQEYEYLYKDTKNYYNYIFFKSFNDKISYELCWIDDKHYIIDDD